MLHKQVVEMIDQYKQEHGAPPENMLAIYEYLHEQEIEAMKEVKMMQQMYKQSKGRLKYTVLFILPQSHRMPQK